MPTVDLGFLVIVFCSIAIAGHIPIISSTSGFCNLPKNCRAYDDKLSIYLLCPSAKSVSNARVDFPEPLTPEITVILSFGISNDMFLMLFLLSPFKKIYLSFLMFFNQFFKSN